MQSGRSYLFDIVASGLSNVNDLWMSISNESMNIVHIRIKCSFVLFFSDVAADIVVAATGVVGHYFWNNIFFCPLLENRIFFIMSMVQHQAYIHYCHVLYSMFTWKTLWNLLNFLSMYMDQMDKKANKKKNIAWIVESHKRKLCCCDQLYCKLWIGRWFSTVASIC